MISEDVNRLRSSFFPSSTKSFKMELKTKKDKQKPIQYKSFIFAVKIIELHKTLLNRNQPIIARQIMRSGTAIGAISAEADHAESKKDFIHKLAMSQKEANETSYWLDLLYETNYISEIEYQDLGIMVEELKKMLASSIITMKKRLNAA